ncbi:arsenate reductase ArsC [Teredinibacter haidensis]|uniref:arsenate reductase ArsC n=1 Tax=Teredinibacter haidensis TaxID=2731755 RepID=UPI000948E13C|nr:arsenate reductase ArsC [Teredinibacter haidensis]
MKALFICTHNRCRSILGEAITNHIGKGILEARSAGSSPVGEVHPLSLKYLQEKGVSTEGLQSQSWDEHESFAPDIVFTVCDSAANEACPTWFGNSIVVHWGLPDPSKLEGSETDIRNAFYAVMATIENRIAKVVQLDLTRLQSTELRAALRAIGDSD